MDKALRARVSMKNPVHFLALGFGSGLIPMMPGTFGSIAALPLLFAMSFVNLYYFLAITVISFLFGIYLCGKTAADMKMHDHGSIVWDEIAGMMVVFIAVPINWSTLLLGFLLFRFFDILKPWPIREFDKKVHGGFGIMIDDIVAGAMACLCLHALVYFFPLT
ncbi:phosphatidylglycerophosphatase A [Glaciecola sp. MH2013]|uniref:phosphatidylglycerophosphatase A family protein n=1 Tax=Glaciecola sp. MH2013 TaxID=2785524 RepID=UPI00189D6E96|nr:phosphatidylglycerophosphatase A [Glaciecola sp. MH2013]MBF7074706.1 phosphatidylglycerophosphatase A [Glaciecola sp. MH2013]